MNKRLGEYITALEQLIAESKEAGNIHSTTMAKIWDTVRWLDYWRGKEDK